MESIQIVQKPQWLSWDDIHEVVYDAHSCNREKGIDIQNAHKSGKELEESLGDDGICFVALYNNKLVGTCSVAFHTLSCWFANGKIAYATLEAVSPNYKGMKIFSKLDKARMKYIESKGVDCIYMKIAEGNNVRLLIAQKQGFHKVSFGRTQFNPHNYIILAKWMSENPCSTLVINMHFFLSWLRIRIKTLFCIIK